MTRIRFDAHGSLIAIGAEEADCSTRGSKHALLESRQIESMVGERPQIFTLKVPNDLSPQQV